MTWAASCDGEAAERDAGYFVENSMQTAEGCVLQRCVTVINPSVLLQCFPKGYYRPTSSKKKNQDQARRSIR